MSTALSLRYMSDDWGVRSDTAQLHLRWSSSGRDWYVEPTFRWYRQTAADFYTPFILNSDKPAIVHESSDSRLGAFHALTYGLKYARKLPGLGSRDESEFSVRAEYYQQTFDERMAVPASACKGSTCIRVSRPSWCKSGGGSRSTDDSGTWRGSGTMQRTPNASVFEVHERAVAVCSQSALPPWQVHASCSCHGRPRPRQWSSGAWSRKRHGASKGNSAAIATTASLPGSTRIAIRRNPQ